jgi:hypothetical protein
MRLRVKARVCACVSMLEVERSLHNCVCVRACHCVHQPSCACRTGAQRLRECLGFDGARVTVKVDAVGEGVPVAAKWVVRERLDASVCSVRGSRRNLARIRVCVEPKEARRAGLADGVTQRKRCAQRQRARQAALCALPNMCAHAGCVRLGMQVVRLPNSASPPHPMPASDAPQGKPERTVLWAERGRRRRRP